MKNKFETATMLACILTFILSLSACATSGERDPAAEGINYTGISIYQNLGCCDMINQYVKIYFDEEKIVGGTTGGYMGETTIDWTLALNDTEIENLNTLLNDAQIMEQGDVAGSIDDMECSDGTYTYGFDVSIADSEGNEAAFGIGADYMCGEADISSTVEDVLDSVVDLCVAHGRDCSWL